MKPLSEFHRRGQGFQSWCKECRKGYDRAYWETHRELGRAQKRIRRIAIRAWHRSLKEGRPCADCGGTFHPAAMTFDHRPGTEKREPVSSLARGFSRRTILAEIAKCDLVCANCHAVRTYNRKRDVAQPG